MQPPFYVIITNSQVVCAFLSTSSVVAVVAGVELVAEWPVAPVEVSGEEVVYPVTCEPLPFSTSK